jgi:2-dehydro-3-deoxyphosphogluconate aldolase/(4S)-4-hydroxy-2-oxoglutarate aldolase
MDQTRLVAVLRHARPELAVETARALLAGGVRVVEISLDSPGALDMLRAIKDGLDGRVAVGAGAVVDQGAAQAALEAGAEFIVSPHTDARMVSELAKQGVACLPGALTPTEILAAWDAGAALVKLFPAGGAGSVYLKMLRGPLRDIPLLPTGGITLENAAGFIAVGAWGLSVGAALADPATIQARRFHELTRRATAFCQAAAPARRTFLGTCGAGA